MRYIFSQQQGNSTNIVIVENPEVKEGTVYATKVGEIAELTTEGKVVFQACTPVKFIAGGGPWDMTEYTKKL